MKVHVAERDIYRTLEERKQERTSRQYALHPIPLIDIYYCVTLHSSAFSFSAHNINMSVRH